MLVVLLVICMSHATITTSYTVNHNKSLYSKRLRSFFLNMTGSRDNMARTARSITLDQVKLLVDSVMSYSVVPVCIAKNDGGATPKNAAINNKQLMKNMKLYRSTHVIISG